MQLDEEAVRLALHGLEDQGLAGVARGADSGAGGRVTKYEHRLQEVFNFTRGETAVMCVLLLRGPQTPGELRGRTERIYRFEELEDVVGVLQKLMQREEPLVAALPRQPGTKEIRYVELLSGSVESHISEQRGDMGHPEFRQVVGHPAHVSQNRGDMGHPRTPTQANTGLEWSTLEERLERIEAELARLREEMDAMRMREGGA